MAHDETKVLLGSTRSNHRDVSLYSMDPASVPAGVAVRLKTDGDLATAKASGRLVGISLGRSLSDTKKTSVARTGLKVPMLLEATPARGVIEITDYENLVAAGADTITVGATVFVAQSGAVTPGDATFRAATSEAATATSLAAQINAHATAGALVVAVADGEEVLLTAKGNTTAGNSIALAYSDEGTATVGATVSGETLEGGGAASDFVALGAKVYISDTSGKADDPSSAATISDAVYASGVLTGINEDGQEVACVLVDMPGGL
jgi:hypothetical protein